MLYCSALLPTRSIDFFQGFEDWCRVTVVVGGAGKEVGPEKRSNRNITYIYTSLNAHGEAFRLARPMRH